MTRAKRGNNNSACTAARVPLIIAGRGSKGDPVPGIRRGRRLLGTQQRHCPGVDGQVRFPGEPSTVTHLTLHPLNLWPEILQDTES